MFNIELTVQLLGNALRNGHTRQRLLTSHTASHIQNKEQGKLCILDLRMGKGAVTYCNIDGLGIHIGRAVLF